MSHKKNFIGTILLHELLHAVRARREGARDQFCIFIGEFQNFASNDNMSIMVNEGRKFGVGSTYMHVERFGQLAHNQKLMGATAATVNKVFFQPIVKDAEEFAPEFAKEADEVKTRTGGELVYSPHAVEDIWERGHTNQEFMIFRERYLFIVNLLKKIRMRNTFYSIPPACNRNIIPTKTLYYSGLRILIGSGTVQAQRCFMRESYY
jgi:hypothetical protein